MQVSSVLVVDDCKLTRAAAARELAMRTVFTARNVDEALECLDHDLDLAIVDQRLGSGALFGAGFALIAELKNALPGLRIASVTGLFTDEGERLARTLGADVVLEKVDDNRGCWIPVAAVLTQVEDLAPPSHRIVIEQRSLDRVKRDHAVDTMRRCNGNIAAAANKLGIGRRTLLRLLGLC